MSTEQYFDAETATTRKCDHGKRGDDYCAECESSVPDCEFERPKTPDELFKVVHLAAEILYAVTNHLLRDSSGAWELASKAHADVVSAFTWIGEAKWIGEAEWKKRA